MQSEKRSEKRLEKQLSEKPPGRQPGKQADLTTKRDIVIEPMTDPNPYDVRWDGPSLIWTRSWRVLRPRNSPVGQ
jgi:hypothetical protein